MNPITVVVINYNGKHHLAECLRSVQEADGQIYEVIVVDDCSTDGSLEFVKGQFPWVKAISLAQNQGPAAARNAGIKAAQTPWVCLLDNDIAVDKRWLVALGEAMAGKEDAVICTSRILVYERPEIIGSDGDDAHFVGMPTQRRAWGRISQTDDSTPQEVGATLGISCLIDKSRIAETAYFDPDFFYNFEELDFCLRNRMLGYKCLVAPQSIVYHKYLTGGVAELSSNKIGYSPKRGYFVFRNRWFVILKLYALRTIIVTAPALFLFELVTILFAVRNRVFRSYLRAWISVMQNLPAILQKRRAIQASRVLSDKMLLSAHQLTLGRGTVHSPWEDRLGSWLSFVFHAYWNLARHLL